MTRITDEFALLEELRALCPLEAAGVRVANGDDAAVWQPPFGTELVATTDMLVENGHFRRTTARWEDIGYKAVAVNYSDLAAMAAQPVGVLCAVALPADFSRESALSLYRGIGSALRRYGGVLLGGDTVRSEAGVQINVTALGTVRTGAAVCRSGARPGEKIVLSRPTGWATLGLACTETGKREPQWALQAFLRPVPELAAAQVLRAAGATSLNDISDGLSSELAEIATASGVGMVIEAARLPREDELAAAAAELGIEAEAAVLHGGEDFALVGTLPAQAAVPAGMYEIGYTTTEPGVRLLRDGVAEELPACGYNHFRRKA